jgi:hypothetical protein
LYSQVREERTGRPEHDSKDRKASKGQLGQDNLGRTVRIGHMKKGHWDRTVIYVFQRAFNVYTKLQWQKKVSGSDNTAL